MIIKQLSVFLENKQGRMCAVADLLAQNNINIRALSLADTTEFGILRLIVDKPEEGKKILSEAGIVVRVTNVLSLTMEDDETSTELEIEDTAPSPEETILHQERTDAVAAAMKQLDEEFLLKTSLWATLLENKTKYSYDEFGYLLVPASDLDVAAKSLYGSGITLEHRSFSEGYDAYNYDEESKTYYVPVLGQTAGYVPKVVEILKSGDTYTLIVGYVAPTTLWNVSEDGSAESVPDKYLYYDLVKIARDDLEVAEIQQMNQTQYLDYDAIQQEAMNQELAQAEAENETAEGEENTEGEASEETSSEGE